ncbi:hypothetical protein DMN91_012324 [Ooceraea biroi]|uniref:Phosphoenolpyruvate carboxykinase GTP-utilising N-terminal domain-containing protein n=2 Tax=Ooceraea biroi TaxID=2015173 RepID=A0A3L8D4K4_OOCBI|nr:hypothetical protein DMN91_012324 [Ooceraea biroi]
MPPKPHCISWQGLTRISQQFTSNRTFSINCRCFSGTLLQRTDLISTYAPKINNRSTNFLPLSVFASKNIYKMPHAVDVYHSQIPRFIVTHAAKNPSTKNGYDYIGKIPLLNTCAVEISPKLRHYIEECASLCCPNDIYICNGTDAEYMQMLKTLQKNGTIKNLSKYEN